MQETFRNIAISSIQLRSKRVKTLLCLIKRSTRKLWGFIATITDRPCTVQKWTLCVSTYISQWSHDRGGADAWPPEGGRRHQSRSRSIQASSSLIFGKCLSAVGGILEEDKNCCIKTDAGVNNIYWKLHGSGTLLFLITIDVLSGQPNFHFKK